MESKHKALAFKSGCMGVILSGFLLTGASITHLQEPASQATPKAAPPTDHADFPAGPGRDITLATCSKCHSPNNILASGHDRQGWQEVILKMVDLGAQGSDEDFAAILDYLSKSFPEGTVAHINVNTATAPQLAAALTLTLDEAKEIVAYRDKNGKFKTFEDLKKVPKVDSKKLETGRDSLVF